MEVLKENNLELVVSSSTPSFQDLLDSQQDLFRSQIDQLQNIVVRQCEVTGVNPLSQEMAAGALSIKIGKRPRDLLNPKAVKYMQSVFSIKDAISKKESREISALFGVTVTQVRDFFNGQRSRVRKSVRLSREKALRANACKEEAQDGVSTSSDPMIPINTVPLNSVGPTNVEGPSCSTQDEILPGIDDSDKNFIENIFAMMRNEETFSGQVKLMEWILQVQNSSVLNWFLTKGSVMILATWLSQAATEEQTSVLHVILKDIWARILLSRWSKVFARSQAMKKPNAKKSLSDVQNERLLQQSIGEIMDNELWESKIDISEDNLAPSYEGSENIRKLESSQPLKLLTASTDDSSKKLIRGVSSSQTRERRKVLLVEQPGQKPGVRSSQVTRSVPANQGRPLSADDIQKAKMRAQFMQSKYGKTGTSSNEGHQVKIEGPNRLPSQASTLFPASRADARSKIEEHKKSVMVPSKVSNQPESPLDKMILDPDEPLWKKCKRVQIPWLTPPEMRIDGDWRLGSGESSKEVEVQKNRIRREKEIVYNSVQEIPANPKDPWDREMDYDDTLTPEIPTEQLPDADGAEPMASSSENENISVTPATTTTTATSSQNGNGGMPEPDLELLAVLLKNPELVFALTSGQGGGNLSSEDTVKLLDMIKANGVGGLGNVSGLGTMAEEKVEVSLPSPTPSSDPVTSGWRSEVAKNPFSRQSSVANREAYVIPGIAGTEEEKRTATSSMRPEIRSADIMVPYQPENFPTLSQQTIPQFRFPQTPTSLPERRIHTSSNIPLPNFQAANSPLRRAETLGHVKPAPVSIVLNTPERQPIEFSIPPLLPTRPQTQPHQPHQMPMPEPPPLAHSWSVRQGFISNPHSQANHDNYNAMVPGPPGPRGRDEYMGEPGYETWSPENSPTRSPEYVSGWNRVNSGHNYRPDQSRPRNSSRYRDHNRYGDRRWRERDRDRRR